MSRTHRDARTSRFATSCLFLLGVLIVAVLWTSGCRKPPVEELSHFALRGLHAPLSCSQCHGGQLTTLPTHCSGCHEPDRPSDHYPGECSDCHTEHGWGEVVVDHSFFPLDWGHAGPACLDCHVEGDYGAASAVCESCHARPPEHFAGTCESCHNIRSWDEAVIDHSFFPLEFGHSNLPCTDCHLDDDYEAASAVCESCHTRPSDHQDGPCDTCHNTIDWDDAEIDHSFFPLSLGHSGLVCADCHDESDYGAADPTCTSCHTRPDGHFQGACDDCHTTRDWEADFDHGQYFPVPHEDAEDCVDCHLSAGSGNYETFSCIHCHDHRRSEMDDEHLGEVDDYVYSSAACFDCHPNGEEDDD